MTKIHQGIISAEGLKIGIIVSRFNNFISEKLLEGALDCLKRHNADEKNIEVAWVPGAWEIPLIAEKLCKKKFDVLICIGAIIRGATPHFDYIATECAKGIAQVSLKSGIPISFGILTCDTLEQAIERAGTKGGNKGFDAALSAMEMANLLKEI